MKFQLQGNSNERKKLCKSITEYSCNEAKKMTVSNIHVHNQ